MLLIFVVTAVGTILAAFWLEKIFKKLDEMDWKVWKAGLPDYPTDGKEIEREPKPHVNCRSTMLEARTAMIRNAEKKKAQIYQFLIDNKRGTSGTKLNRFARSLYNNKTLNSGRNLLEKMKGLGMIKKIDGKFWASEGK